MLGYEVEASTCDFGQSLSERQTPSEQVVAPEEIHQEVNVAIQSLLAASYRTEHADTASAELAARGKDGLSLCVQHVKQHGHGLAAVLSAGLRFDFRW